MPPKPASANALLADLACEHEDLDIVVSGLSAFSWDSPTPAEGWAVRDQISHLAFFDDAATMALVDPDAFARMATEALAREGDPMEEHLRRGRQMTPGDLLSWWRTSREEMLGAARSIPDDARIPWFGPPMGLMSFVSARVMETWAHGQDVADAVGVTRVPTDRLRHVAHIGVRARGFSYVVRGLEPPAEPVRVELTSPSGDSWVWDGDADRDAATHSVTGNAVDFCLVVTQRRHVSDTSLSAHGDLATGWLEIAQAFAGPPGSGRAPASTPGG